MKSPKVNLSIRIRVAGKDVFAKPVYNRNGALRERYALVGSRAEHHPKGIYYLRFAPAGQKRVWLAVGPSADAALAALRNKSHDLQAESLGRGSAEPSLESGGTTAQPALLVSDAIAAYLQKVTHLRAPKTVAAYTNYLSEFGRSCGTWRLTALTRDDLLGHSAYLKRKGLSERTVFNHLAHITAFLREHGIAPLLTAYDKPRYDQRAVSAYSVDQLQRLFEQSPPESRLLWEFFLSTGFREQEVSFCTWGDVDFTSKVITVRSKPRSGFRPKDREERSVPVPDTLIAALAERKRASHSHLLFPTAKGKVDRHMLRRLQAVAYRAGLNCGECVNKAGKSCGGHPVCQKWGLHKFRKSFSTLHAEAGVAIPTIQGWLGHSDLETTLRYLAVADLRSSRTREQVNRSFHSMTAAGAA